MTEIVGGFGVPHTPFFPALVARADEAGREVGRLFELIGAPLRASDPDVIVFFLPDHYTEFFETIPIFNIAVADSAPAPCDYPELGIRELPIARALAAELHAELVQGSFDVTLSREPLLDHSALVPMQLLAPELELPLVPLRISAFDRPLPSAQRCYELGRRVRSALEGSGLFSRAALLSTGSFSLDIGGPRMSDTSHASVPDPAWLHQVLDLLGAGRFEQLVADATDARLAQAGAEAGELLIWIAMLGALDPAPPAILEAQPEYGHAYAAWVPDGGVAP